LFNFYYILLSNQAECTNLFIEKNMTITITTHNNNPGLPAYVGQGAAALAGMKIAAINLNGGGILNINNHLELTDLTGNATVNTQQGSTIEVHNNCDPLIIQGNIDLRFPATSIPHGVTVEAGANITLQSQSTHGLDLAINNNNPANPTIVTLTAGTVSSMIVNVGQNEFTIKNQEGENLTFDEFNAQEFNTLSQFIINNYDPTTGSVDLTHHQGELLVFKKYSSLLEDTKFWYTTIIDDFREYAPSPLLLSAAEFINSHWLEINGVNMNHSAFEELPVEVMGYLGGFIADGDI
jgi:hypothetical protein